MTDKENGASPEARIEFQEVSANASDFLHELNDPNLLRNRDVPSAVKMELLEAQISRLRATILVLGAKREEFNRKMEEYIRNLTQLVATLEKSFQIDDRQTAPNPQTTHRALTKVCCMHCAMERRFEGLKVVFARESEESLSQPTELYVLEHGSLKKGHFRCLKCGTESLVIKAN